MGDLLLRSLPMCLAPAPIGGFRRLRMAMRRRFGGGSSIWGLCQKRSVRAGASDLELIYSTESSDGSVVFRFGTSSEIAEYVALKKAESEDVSLVEGTLQENVVTGDEVVEGLADEVLETQLPVKDVEKSSLEMEHEVAQVEDGKLEENIVSVGKEERLEGFADEVVNKYPFVEMQKDENVCTSGSSENLRGVQVGSNYVGVSDSLNLILDEPGERLSTYEEKASVVENSMSNEIDVGRDNIVSVSEKIGDSGIDFVQTLGIENVSDEKRSVLGDNIESNLEHDNVNGSSIDDFGGNMGEDNTYLENSNSFHENADGDELKESVAVKSNNSGEDSESCTGYESTIPEEDIIVDEDLDPMAPEPDVEARLSLDEASSYVAKEVISRSEDKEIPVVNGTVTSNEERAWVKDKEYVDVQKTSTSEVDHQENTRDDVSVVGQPSANNILNQNNSFETSDASISLISIVPDSLSSSKGGFSDKSSNEINVIQKTLAIDTSYINQEDTDGSISVETIPVASQLKNENSVGERISFDSEEGFLCSTGIDNLNLTAEKATPGNELIKISQLDILRDSATDISFSKGQVADREEASSVRLCLSIGAALLPKTLEAITGGEDAYFIAGETWFGVADGEGQWSLEGIDAGLYGHELMEYCRRIVSDSCYLTTKEVLCRSAAEATLPGSATILLANFDGQVLHALNIGDTGFVIVRNGAIMSRSMPTVHDFHFPHQIQKGDDPLEFVEVYEIELDEGDIIVAATDGLFDNMYDRDIASIVTKSLHANLSPEEVAAVLAVKAQEIGRSTSTRSPFADEAQAAGYAGFTGGKLDDVAVIVSVVQKKS